MKDEEGDYIGVDKDSEEKNLESALREHIQDKLRENHRRIV